MYYLTAAVVLVGALCVFDLVLSLGVVRRLRAQDEILARLTSRGTEPTVPVGRPVGTFVAQAVDGTTVSRDGSGGVRLVGFFSPDCDSCAERVPEFIAYRERTGVAALAIVVADDAGGQTYVSGLSASADVVVEPPGGPVGRAFQLNSFPALCLIDRSGVVLATGNSIDDLPDLVPA